MQTYAVYRDIPLDGMTMDKCIEVLYGRGFSANYIRMILQMKYQGSWSKFVGIETMRSIIYEAR